jgi:hypothetical protein
MPNDRLIRRFMANPLGLFPRSAGTSDSPGCGIVLRLPKLVLTTSFGLADAPAYEGLLLKKESPVKSKGVVRL